MTTQEALDFYDGKHFKLARALGIWVTAIYQWGEYPPVGRQYQIEVLTDGALKAERNDDDAKQ